MRFAAGSTGGAMLATVIPFLTDYGRRSAYAA